MLLTLFSHFIYCSNVIFEELATPDGHFVSVELPEAYVGCHLFEFFNYSLPDYCLMSSR